MNEKIAQYIRQGNYKKYLDERFPEIDDYEELIFSNEDFHGVDWSNFPSSMNVFKNCNLDDLTLSSGQPIRIEGSSAKNMNICGITAIIHALESDFTDLKYDDETVLADNKNPSDIPSTFEKCIFDPKAKSYFEKQGVIFKD